MSTPETLRKIFIGSIPEAVQESEIRAAASRFGTITTFHYNQAPRGWALVTFEKPEEANAAVSGLNDRVVFSACQAPVVCRIANEKKIGVDKKKAQQQIATAATNAGYMYGSFGVPHGSRQSVAGTYGMTALAGIPEQPPPQPMQWLTYYTPEGHPYYYNILTKTTQWEKPNDLGQALVRPSTTTAATFTAMSQAQILAYNQQQQKLMMMGVGTPSMESSVNPEALGAKKFGPPGCNLFVFHIPSEWSHKDLYDACGAIKSMHGFNVGGKWLKVTLKKGEEHLLPSNLQAVYQKMSSKIDMQFPSSYQSKENGDSQSTPHMTQSEPLTLAPMMEARATSNDSSFPLDIKQTHESKDG